MLSTISQNWWVFLLRGLLALAFGVIALLWPGIALGALILLFAFYALGDGVAHLIALVAGFRVTSWWAHLLAGVLSIAAGIFALVRPGLTAGALLLLIAVWAIVTGVLEIISAIRFRQEIDREWLYVLGGLLSVALGVLFLVLPGAGILSLLWLIGVYALAEGIVLIGFAFRVRGAKAAAAS